MPLDINFAPFVHGSIFGARFNALLIEMSTFELADTEWVLRNPDHALRLQAGVIKVGWSFVALAFDRDAGAILCRWTGSLVMLNVRGVGSSSRSAVLVGAVGGWYHLLARLFVRRSIVVKVVFILVSSNLLVNLAGLRHTVRLVREGKRQRVDKRTVRVVQDCMEEGREEEKRNRRSASALPAWSDEEERSETNLLDVKTNKHVLDGLWEEQASSISRSWLVQLPEEEVLPYKIEQAKRDKGEAVDDRGDDHVSKRNDDQERDGWEQCSKEDVAQVIFDGID